MIANKIKAIMKTDIRTIIDSLSDDFFDYFSFFILLLFIASPVLVSFYGLTSGRFEIMLQNHILLLTGIYGKCIWFLSTIYLILFIIKKHKNLKNIFKDTTNITYIIFSFLVIWMMISTFVNGWNFYALEGDLYRNESLFTQMSYFIFYFFISSQIKNDLIKRKIIYIQIIISIYIALCGFHFWNIFPDSKFYSWKSSLTSVYFNINHYAYYLTICIMLSSAMIVIETNKKLITLCTISIIVNTIALSFNNTFGGWLACLLALLFQIIMYLIIKRKIEKKTLIPLIVFILTTLITGIWTNNVFSSLLRFILDVSDVASNSENSAYAGSSRWRIWKGTISLIPKKPIFGYGIEATKANNLFNIVYNERTHNEYLQYTYWYGVPAGIAYFVGCLSIYLNGLKNKTYLSNITKVCLVSSFGYLVSAFFGNTMFYTSPYLFIHIGMSMVKHNY